MEELYNIIARDVDVNNLNIKEDLENRTIEIANKIDDQVIIVQSTKDGIWVRHREPSTDYCCESEDLFESYIEALLNNRVEVCVGCKEDEWIETIIVPTHNYDEMKDGLDYCISSWVNTKKT